MAHRFSCPAACVIFLDQGSNPCSLHWQMDSYPLDHQGSPELGKSRRRDCLSLENQVVVERRRKPLLAREMEREWSLMLDRFRLGGEKTSQDSPAAETQKTGQG